MGAVVVIQSKERLLLPRMKDLDREANLVPLCLYSQPGYPPPTWHSTPFHSTHTPGHPMLTPA